jgi:hypothetical protein
LPCIELDILCSLNPIIHQHRLITCGAGVGRKRLLLMYNAIRTSITTAIRHICFRNGTQYIIVALGAMLFRKP